MYIDVLCLLFSTDKQNQKKFQILLFQGKQLQHQISDQTDLIKTVVCEIPAKNPM